MKNLKKLNKELRKMDISVKEYGFMLLACSLEITEDTLSHKNILVKSMKDYCNQELRIDLFDIKEEMLPVIDKVKLLSNDSQMYLFYYFHSMCLDFEDFDEALEALRFFLIVNKLLNKEEMKLCEFLDTIL